jgi:predicted flavoprotein YhiN
MEISKNAVLEISLILNIDAITGGFNFQNAWTGGFIVANRYAK